MTPKDLEAIEERASKAIPLQGEMFVTQELSIEERETLREFHYVCTPAAVAALCQALREAWKELDELRDKLEHLPVDIDDL